MLGTFGLRSLANALAIDIEATTRSSRKPTEDLGDIAVVFYTSFYSMV
jgi:hypothetical protein